ncbi:MAG: ABC transporter ATP-binding protein [Anaeroplasma sp.]
MHKANRSDARAKDFKKTFKKLLSLLKPHMAYVIVAIVLSIIASVCNIFGPKTLGKITEACYMPIIDFEYITKIGVILIIIYVSSALCNYFCGFIMTGVTQKICRDMRENISLKINKIPLAYFDRTSFGDVLSRVTNDIDTVGQNLNQSATQMISSITTFIGVFIMMLTLSPIMTLIPLISIPLSMIFMLIVVKISQKYFRNQQRSLGKLNGHIEEAYSGQIIIKAFNQEDNKLQEFDKCNDDLKRSAWKSQFLSGLMMPLMLFIGNLSYVAICIIGGLNIVLGNFGLEYIQMFIQYTRMFNQPLQQIGQITNVLQSCAAAAERVFEFLELDELSEEKDCITIEKEKIVGIVEFKNVNFGYLENKQIIFDFNCEVKAGNKIAIVGPTGAGKTTMVNLLMKFYETNSGDILIDNVPISKISRENIASLFGMVLQDTWLFEGTIRDNLKFGNKNATDEEIWAALKSANMDHFVHSLPGGLDYVLDENANVSAGQKQLLTIARAMIENSPMLILDEATSSVDTRTEILIQNAMDKLMEGRTSFVIAHRLSTIKNANKILVMNNGNIIEQGTHDELLSLHGFYYDLYNSQFQE